MRTAKPILLCALVAVVGALAPVARARVGSDIVPADKRRLSVEKAALLAKQVKPAPLPEPLSLPFAPPNFELSDAEEAAAALAAARLANPGSPNLPAPPTDHQLLEEIGAKVRPNGTMFLNGKPLLMFGKSFVKTGAHFTVTYKGADYDLELTQIDGTNFTLRYKNDEITRPIKPAAPAKSP